jgi:glycosyltransferase involved in cell wall biosynthesis
MFVEPGRREGAAYAERPEKVLSGDRMPSVCFVAPHAWPVLSGDRSVPVVGGAEVQQAILARLLAAAGHRVSMITLDFGQRDRARVDGVLVLKTFKPHDGVPALRFLHPRVTSMWRALSEVDADIYYYRSAAMWVGVLAEFCRRRGKRLVYAGASDKDFDRDQGGQIRFARDRWLFRRGVERAHAIVAQNERQRAACKATYGRDAVVIPSCYVPPANRSSRERNLVLWVGTLHENKRPELLLELARRLPQRRFVMVGGPGPNPAFYDAIRGRAAAIPNLEFKGFLPLAEVERWFDRARVLVNTSTYEGMPNTFLQAWARGIPTAALVDVGAPVHRVAGDLEQLAALVEEAFADPELGKACREHFERAHSRGGVLRQYQRLFKGLRP